MNRLKGKVAVVTGGALGIGRATCLRMAEEGATVVVADVKDKEGRALVKAITGLKRSAVYRHLDVTDEANARSVMTGVARKFGRLDVLVNNAGISGASKPTHELTEAEWDQTQAVNVKGVFFCTKHALPAMMAARAGSIVNLSSIYGLVGAPDAPPYHASKGAVRLMSKTDAMLYAPYGIRVNSVHPGYIWTPMVEAFLQTAPDPDAARHAVDAKHPLGHMGEADDIAWGIVYLASDESRFVTGSELVIDGGYTAQ
jgi:NAD(P)-dependent dehydrogenase (short-subunit alcohol dehydrogenase family)